MNDALWTPLNHITALEKMMIKIEKRGNLTSVEFTDSEPGKSSLVNQIETKLDAIIANPNSQEIEINMSQVSAIANSFLVMLRRFNRRATAYGLKVRLCGVSENVSESLKMAGLLDRIETAVEAA